MSDVGKYIPVSPEEVNHMLKTIGVSSLDELMDRVIPAHLRKDFQWNIPDALSEQQLLEYFDRLASENKVLRSLIGRGFYGTFTPPVIRQNILENPNWYTQYTPYQAEISQGRLEALLVFQTMIENLTGMEIANASLLDEGTAAAEAMTFMIRIKRVKENPVIWVHESVYHHTYELLKGRANPMGITLLYGSVEDVADKQFHGLIFQMPDTNGALWEPFELIRVAREKDAAITLITDPLALVLMGPPAAWDIDVVVGSVQRFGLPLGFGGPHAGFFATKMEFVRQIPGRIIGVSRDKNGNIAYRMTLQTREQHIRRERATSNICTSQSLMAIASAFYAVYHGNDGLRRIAERIHHNAIKLDRLLAKHGIVNENKYFFDTIRFKVDNVKTIKERALSQGYNFWYEDNYVSISLDELTDDSELMDIVEIITGEGPKELPHVESEYRIPQSIRRDSPPLSHPVFEKHTGELRTLRYIRFLEKRDLSMTETMIPLGSCTMKLNITATLYPLSLKGFNSIHPFAPSEQVSGYLKAFEQLRNLLCEITGMDACSLQPQSGAQGELTGLLVIRKYFQEKGENQRDIVLIPASAHGTNPASAVMAGFKVHVIKTAKDGSIDIEHLKSAIDKYGDSIAALMVTYPSTHGVFEQDIDKIIELAHSVGAQVYMDGANLNAMIGFLRPGDLGADVCHVNLHKTFGIPHGGGGPGAGPICVKKHLADYLPSHPYSPEEPSPKAIEPVASAPYGNSMAMLISLGYILLLGKEGLPRVAQHAILNANYLKKRLEPYFPVLYTGKDGFVAHEFILDFRTLKREIGVDAIDLAKRLIDYSFHAPTVSFPVPGTFMIEPTETEPLEELERFISAMVSIYNEIEEIRSGLLPREDNPIRNAPHTINEVSADDWTHPYSREKASFPLDYLRKNKFWAPVGRIDEAYGDRHIFCACPSPEEMEGVSC